MFDARYLATKFDHLSNEQILTQDWTCNKDISNQKRKQRHIYLSLKGSSRYLQNNFMGRCFSLQLLTYLVMKLPTPMTLKEFITFFRIAVFCNIKPSTPAVWYALNSLPTW